jgi:thiol-disulfide isomerase/thioredoxin
MLKLFTTSLLLSLLIISCQEERKKNVSTINIEITNNESLDSLIIYNKENSWEVMTCLRFKNSNKILDTLNIKETKLYPVYSFKNGIQGEVGELILSSNSQVGVSMNDKNIFETINYSGSFELENDFLAYSKKQQNQLSDMVKKGIENEVLASRIEEKKELIIKEANTLKITDSINTYVIDRYNQFSKTLKKKNIKYLYKASLINTLGNNFIFKDSNDNNVSLAEYKGKYVYIDVWATWCKPCKEEYVFLKKLEKHFAYTDKLKIISISLDRDHDKWKNYLVDNATEGIQLYSGDKSDFGKFYDIGALPRFIFLDTAGKIINPDEIRPSNPETLKILEATIKTQL